MKNIHVLPTDKPSRLYRNLLTDKLFILENSVMDVSECNREYQNMYITYDEEIKNGYAFHLKTQEVLKVKGVGEKSKEIFHSKGFSFPKDCRKIILTTDQDLIKDGVQAIDDEFLEWFVENPSCEFVEIDLIPYDGTKSINKYWGGEYKIIIPKEEPKQETLEEVGAYQQELFSYLHDLGIIALQSEMQEIERIVLSMQDKNKYSEEEVIFFIKEAINHPSLSYNRVSVEDWFEQFKKK